MAPQTFTTTLTTEQKAALTAKAQTAGIDPSGGTLPPSHGVMLSFQVSGLVVIWTVVSKPWYITPSMIQGGIHDFIASESAVTGG